jgi:hypothetical protein
MINKNKRLSQSLTVFSDGSLILNFNRNKKDKKTKYLEKDFKLFQKNLKENSSINFNKIDNIMGYRKKLFK